MVYTAGTVDTLNRPHDLSLSVRPPTPATRVSRAHNIETFGRRQEAISENLNLARLAYRDVESRGQLLEKI